MSWTSGDVINTTSRMRRLSESIPSSYTIWKDGTTYRAECNIAGGTDYPGIDASTVIQSAITATVKGTVYVKAMTADLTSQITCKPDVPLIFEAGGVFNVLFNGTAFYGLGVGAGSAFTLHLGASFYLYDYAVPILVRLDNSRYSDIFIRTVGSGSGTILTAGVGVTLKGDPAYYNRIKILLAYDLHTAIELPFDTVGANANTIEYLFVNNCYYGVKISENVSDNCVHRLVVGGGGIPAGGAAVYLDGFGNHVWDTYGEYNTAGVLLHLDTHALNNIIPTIVQEGAGGLVTNGSALKNDIGGKVGYITKSSGTETGNGAQQTIDHLCNFTPTYDQVFLSERSTGGALAYQSAAPDADHIYVTAVNAKTYNWRVEK